MVTIAKREGEWGRASYLEADATRAPQAIAALLPQVLARYAIAPEMVQSAQVQMDDREYEGEEDVHTLAATAM
jgi:hypothetical protein